jgi:GAF domain-containing protein
MTDKIKDKDVTSLEELLQQRKALLDITNRIHAAQNIKQILVDLKDGILSLFSAHSLTIYVLDRMSNEIYSMFLAGTELKEIRMEIDKKSIAGYVASAGKVVNIADAYDSDELRSIDGELIHDSSWDKKTGFRTRQVLAAPIFQNKIIMGVVQVLNKKGGAGKFSEDEAGFLLEITNILGIAFYNQERYARRRKTRFDFLLSRGLLKEEELDSAWEDSREAKETVETYLIKKYKVSREDIGRSFEEFFRCKFISFSDKYPIPGDLLKNLKKEYLRRELWVPLEKKDGAVQIIVDDPNNILKRDMIENLLKTKSVRYNVSFPDDIIKFINHFFHSPEDESSFTEILGKLGAADEEFQEEEDDEVVRYSRRTQRREKKRRGSLPGRRRLRPLSDPPLQLPGGHRFAHQNHVEPGHHGPTPPPGWKDQVQETGRRGDGTARRHHPDPGRGGRCRDEASGEGGNHAPGGHGDVGAQSPGTQEHLG